MNFLSVLYAKAGITVDGVTTLNNTATALTPATNDNSTKIATTAFVKNQNYYPYPTGTTAQYVRGDGSLATLPSIAAEAQRLITEVYNETGATLTKGTVVYINGGHGNLPTITKALATSDATSAQTYGVVQNDITDNNNGFVVVIGSITDIPTNTYLNGTILYLSPITAGEWTSTKPYAPQHIVYVGIVTRSHPTQGVVEVRVQNGYEMDELHNVSAQSPANGDILQFNFSTQLWTKTTGNTTAIAEGTNLYFTDARARAAISLTTIGTSGAATYVGGVLNIPQYQAALTNPVTGTGTTNYLPKFTGASALGNSNLINDSNGNLGLGVTPSPWSSSLVRAFQIGNLGASISSYTALNTSNPWMFMDNNAYNDGTNDKYILSKAAARYVQVLNEHRWLNAPTGTAGDTISFTQAMTLDANGRLAVGSTSPTTRFEVYGGHNDTTARLYSTGNGSTLNASLDMWASEPGVSYDGSGIGNNVNGSPFYGRRNSALGQSYIRFISGQIIFYTGTTTANPYLTIAASGVSTFSGNVNINNAPNDADIAMTIQASAGSNKFLLFGRDSSSSAVCNISSAGAATFSSLTTTAGSVNYGGANTYVFGDNSDLYLGTSGNSRIKITSGGNVLIGTTTDAGYKLDVNGTARANNSLILINGAGDAYSTKISTAFDVPGQIIQSFIDSNAGTAWEGRLFFRTSSNGGALTTQLTIEHSGAATFSSSVTANGTLTVNEDGASTKIITIRSNWAGVDPAINVTTNNSLLLMTNNTERMRITSAGNVGIGSASPAYKLDVSGEANLRDYLLIGNSQSYFGDNGVIENGTADGNTRIQYFNTKYLAFKESGTERMRIAAGGNLLINTTTDAGYKLDVNGTARVSGALTANNGIFNGVSSTNLKVQNGANANTLFLIQSFGTEALGENASILFKSAANSTDTTYAKGLISFVNNGTGYGRGSLIFATNNSTNSTNVTASDVKLTIASTGAATFSSSVTTGGQILVNTGTANQNTKIFGDKVGMSRTSDGAEVVYFSKNTDLGTEGTANIQGYNGIQFRTQGAETVKLTIAENGASTFSSSVTATNFIGAGTGLTGTASALSIGGNAATATTAGALTSMDISQFTNDSGYVTSSVLGDYLPLTGGALTGNLTTNSSIGIGTASPATALDVVGGAYSNTTAKFGNTKPIYIINDDPHIGFNTYYNSGWFYGAGSSSNFAGALGCAQTTGDFTLQTSTAAGNAGNAVTFVALMTWKQNGFVGIGTNVPSQRLEVNGNIKLSGAGGATATPSYIWLGNDYSNGVTRNKLKIYLYNSGTEQYGFTVGSIGDVQYHSNSYHDFYIANTLSLRINSSGDVGIGTASPQGKLSVDGGNINFNYGNVAANYYVYLNHNNSNDGGIIWQRNNSNDWQMVNAASSGDFWMYSYSTATVSVAIKRVTGYVGIGTLSPEFLLDVAGGNARINGVMVGKGSNSVSTNLAVGVQALYSNTSGSENTAVGYLAMYSTTTAIRNTALGNNALYSNTTGASNVAVGVGSLYSNIVGRYNSSVGYNSMQFMRGEYNSALGRDSMRGSLTAANNTGEYNTAVGYESMLVLTSGNWNTAVGNQAGANLSTGSYNTFIGRSTVAAAGGLVTTGSNNTIIGGYAGTTTLANTVVLADGAGQVQLWATGKNVALGTTSPTTYANYTTLHIAGQTTTNGGVLRLTTSDSSIAVNIFTNNAGANYDTTTSHSHLFNINGASSLIVSSSGIETAGSITTADPGLGAAAWQLGDVQNATISLITNRYVEVVIGGSSYQLALVQLE